MVPLLQVPMSRSERRFSSHEFCGELGVCIAIGLITLIQLRTECEDLTVSLAALAR